MDDVKGLEMRADDGGKQGTGLKDTVANAKASLVDDDTAVDVAELFKMISDPTRVQIISLLEDCELCVGDIASLLGMSISAISHQLRLLRRSRLVRWHRQGREIHYTLDDEHVGILLNAGLEHVRHG